MDDASVARKIRELASQIDGDLRDPATPARSAHARECAADIRTLATRLRRNLREKRDRHLLRVG